MIIYQDYLCKVFASLTILKIPYFANGDFDTLFEMYIKKQKNDYFKRKAKSSEQTEHGMQTLLAVISNIRLYSNHR